MVNKITGSPKRVLNESKGVPFKYKRTNISIGDHNETISQDIRFSQDKICKMFDEYMAFLYYGESKNDKSVLEEGVMLGLVVKHFTDFQAYDRSLKINIKSPIEEIEEVYYDLIVNTAVLNYSGALQKIWFAFENSDIDKILVTKDKLTVQIVKISALMTQTNDLIVDIFNKYSTLSEELAVASIIRDIYHKGGRQIFLSQDEKRFDK